MRFIVVLAIFLGTAEAVHAQAAATPPVKLGDVVVAGSLRTRVEGWDWFQGAANKDYVYSGNLARIGLSQTKKRYDWQVEFAVPFLLDLPDDAIAAPAAGQEVTPRVARAEDYSGCVENCRAAEVGGPHVALGERARGLLVELKTETPSATAEEGKEAAQQQQQKPAAPPEREGTFRSPKFLEGVQLDLDFYYRFLSNTWGDILAAGRTDFKPAPSGTPEQLHEYEHTSFFNHRSFVAFRVIRPQKWNVNIEMDLLGSDFNDGALMGAEPTGILGAAGMRRASIDVRRVWFEGNWGRVRAQVGRLGMRFGNGILANVNRDGARAFWNVNPRVQLVGVWFRGSQGSTIGESGDVNVDDKSGVQVVVNPFGGTNDALNAFIGMMNYQPVMTHRLQVVVAKQVEGTFDERQPEKLYVDANGGGTVQRQFTYAWEAAYLGGHNPRNAIVGTRLENQAYLLYGNGSYKLPANRLGGRLTLGVTGGFGSGDANPLDVKQNSMQSLFTDETAYEYTIIYADDILGFNGSAASVGNAQGFNNTKFIQPSVQAQARKDLSVRFTYTLLRAHKAQLEGTGPLGNGRFGVNPFLVFAATSTATTTDIGREFDFYADYTVDKNVQLLLRAGWLDPGAIFGAGTHKIYKALAGLEFRF